MKSIGFFLSCLCLLAVHSPISGQTFQVFKGDTINRLDAKGQKQGLWRKYYPTDTLFSEGVYKNSMHTGTFRSFHPNGKLQAILHYRGIAEVCDAEIFSSEGVRIAKGKYIDKSKDSLWNYYDEEGKLSSSESYSRGKAEGVWKIFYKNGQVSHETTYKAGVKSGPYKEYFESGILKIQGTMKQDQLEGALIVFHPNGKPWQQGQYKSGEKDGLWLIFKENGEKEREDQYKAGKLLTPRPEDE